MPSLDIMRRINQSKSGNIGQQIKEQSDMVMQETWYNDVQTRKCYLYDYYHDDNPNIRTGYIPNTDKGKIEVDLKFIVTVYKSIAKDDPEYHVQFSPNDWNGGKLVPEWFDLYSKNDIHFPIGLYVDIPDDKGVYWKWQIVYEDVANQFPKFGVIKCNYLFRWVTDNSVNRYLRHMWGTQRTQSSYNSGQYVYDKTTKVENQSTFWIPWNPISCELYYNQRIIVSMPMARPITYQISKVENTIPKGVNKFTLYQDEFNQDFDYVNLDENSEDYGVMYADYYQRAIEPTDKPNPTPSTTDEMALSCALSQVKIGGGYKTLTATILNENKEDITNTHTDYKWSYYIDEVDVGSELITELVSTEVNKIKIKFNGDEEYLGKILTVKCCSGDISGEMSIDIVAL